MSFPNEQVLVSSWGELMAALHSRDIIQLRPDEGGHLRSPYVFRGVDDATWPSRTSISRLSGLTQSNSQLIERALIRNFRKYANSGEFDSKSEWYILAVAQHNGLPTRCLDWTSSPLVAAHFACWKESHKDVDGAIWCLHAGMLRSINEKNVPTSGSLRGIAWVYDTILLDRQFGGIDGLDRTLNQSFQNYKGHLMLLWEPPSLDGRIQNQAGLLSVMNDVNAQPEDFLRTLDPLYPGLIVKIVIKSQAKPEIRDMLDNSNITERMLFPGMPGLCDWLKRYYGKAW